MAGASSTSSLLEGEEIQGFLRLYSDGSIWRRTNPSLGVPVQDEGSVLWKDVIFDQKLGLQLRVYKPAAASGKLPILLYFHGGGFVIGSCKWSNFHNFTFRLASQLPALVVSADYRLAPEDRLPAAIDDGYRAMKWLQDQAVSEDCDPWLANFGDFGRVFISGDSAGGNLAHNLAVRIGASPTGLDTVRIRGYVLLYPFFGGTARTKSETEAPKDGVLTLEGSDKSWRLAVQIGETRDYPLANPFGPRSPNLEHLELESILVLVGERDLLKDRVEDYAQKLMDWGKKVKYVAFKGAPHGFFTIDPNSDAANQGILIIKHFIEMC